MNAQLITKLLTIGGLILTCAAQAINNSVNDRKQEELIDKKIKEKLK